MDLLVGQRRLGEEPGEPEDSNWHSSIIPRGIAHPIPDRRARIIE
jgi:hypothetical protein